MGRQAFIFSLDAFVAFTLIMITISLLLFSIGTPKPYYPSLEQAHQLAHDTLTALATSSDDPAHDTYLGQILADSSQAKPIMRKVAGGDPNNEGIIPKGYGYRLETYQFNKSGNTGGWNSPIYDSGQDCGGGIPSDRCGKNFTKLQASATTFASIYVFPPKPGESPYCFLSCFGYPGPHDTEHPCNATPCDIPLSNFYQGNNSIQLIRLVVYT